MYPEGKKNILKLLWKDLLNHSKETVLNKEHRNFLISILIEDLLPDIKKQVENNVDGWVSALIFKFQL